MSVATKIAHFAQKPLPEKRKAITATIGAVTSDFLPPVLLRAANAVIRQCAPTHSETLLPYQRDEFLTWLTWINPGNLISANLPLFNHAIQRMPDGGAVVEIGSWCGLSLNHIIHMMQQNRRSNLVFSVDEWHFEGSGALLIPGSDVRFSDYRDLAIETFRRNLLLFHADHLPHHIVVSSGKFFELWIQTAKVVDFFGRETTLGGPVSLAYIDGDHTYEQSWRDFKNVDRFLLPGGFIIFDDSADGCEWGSQRTAREAASRPDYELVAKAPNYCIAKRR